MRLSDEQVKELLRHDDRDVRDFALLYFANSFSLDPTVMPVVIEEFQRRGDGECFGFWCGDMVAQLQQTPETVEWALATLENPDAHVVRKHRNERTGTVESCAHCVMGYADATLTYPFRVRLDKLLRESQRALLRNLQDRWDWLDSSVENLWDELNRKLHKARRADKWPTYPEFVEALARHPEAMKPRVLEGLQTAVVNQDFDSHDYAMSAILVDIAGKARLNEAAELIARTFEFDTDIDNEKAQYALIRLGSPEAIAAVEQRILDGVKAARWYGPGVLGKIHSDEAIVTGLRLLEQSQQDDAELCEELVYQLLLQPSHEVLDAIYAHLSELDDDFGDYWQARRDCVQLGKVLGRNLPLFRDWTETLAGRLPRGGAELNNITAALRHLLGLDDKRLPEVRNPRWLEQNSQVIDIAPTERTSPEPFAEPFLSGGEEAAGYDSWSEPSAPASERSYEMQRPVRVAHLPGRNDPCPCGSGKKFKKCCWGK